MVQTQEGVGITSYATMVSPARARRWLEEADYERQRPLSRQFVDYLEQMIRNGTFKSGAIEFARLGDRQYITDGRHRLTAISRGTTSVPLVIVEHDVADMDEVNALYGRTDRGRSRSFTDVYAAYGLQENLGLTRRQVHLLGSAAVLVASNFTKMGSNNLAITKSSDARVRLATAWAEPGRRLYNALEGGWEAKDRRFQLAGVLATGLVTFRYTPDRASGFWSSCAQNDGLRRGSPQHTLVQWLSLQENRRYRENHIARAVARAWNAYYHDRELTVIRNFESSDPIEIAGSPFNGRQASLPSGLVSLVPSPGG